MPLFGERYVGSLVAAHDGAIARAWTLAALAAKERLTGEDAVRAVEAIREILPHVSDCDGLTIMVELLPDPSIESILATRDAAREEALDLLTWAAEVRPRTA